MAKDYVSTPPQLFLRGTTCSEDRPAAVRMLNGWSKAVSASTSIDSGMNSLGWLRRSLKGCHGATQAVVMRIAAVDVIEVVIPNAGHWLMEETVLAVRQFLCETNR